MYLFGITRVAEGDGNPNSYFDKKEMVGVNIDPLLDFVFTHFPYILGLVGLALSIRLIHKRKFLTLLTPNENLNWKRIFWGFGLYFGLITGTILLTFFLNPGNFSVNDINLQDFLMLFILVLFLTPIQTTAEEVFFRGYLMQMFGRKIHHPLFLSTVVGLLFASLHFSNPEMSYSAFFVGSDYVLSGVLWCYITARTNSAELTIGAHAANNMFLGWFLTMDNSVFSEIPSLFVVKNLDPKISLLCTIISLSIFTYFAIKKYGKKTNIPVYTGKTL